MKFIKIKTRALLPPKDDIYPILDLYLPKLHEGDVVLITSKILAIHQGRCLPIGNINKDDLIFRESERYIPRSKVPHQYVILTVKDYTLIPSSGIDESNANGHYILWPKNTVKLLKEIRAYLKKKNKIKNLALIATDSHTTPLRRGVNGISIGFYGMEPLYDYRGKKDIFGRKLKMTQTNIVDALSSMAVFLMGEGNERIPIVIIRGLGNIKFTAKDTYKKLVIPPSEDIYYPLLKSFRSKKNAKDNRNRGSKR